MLFWLILTAVIALILGTLLGLLTAGIAQAQRDQQDTTPPPPQQPGKFGSTST